MKSTYSSFQEKIKKLYTIGNEINESCNNLLNQQNEDSFSLNDIENKKDIKYCDYSDDNENNETLPTKSNNYFINKNDLFEMKYNQMIKDEENIYKLHGQIILQYKTLKQNTKESSFIFSCSNSRKEVNIDNNNKDSCIIV